MFRPSVQYLDNNHNTIKRTYKSYRELKKSLKGHCGNCKEDEGVFVCRYRRGEWGEWFERWKLDDNGKPYIVKQGWM